MRPAQPDWRRYYQAVVASAEEVERDAAPYEGALSHGCNADEVRGVGVRMGDLLYRTLRKTHWE